MRSLVVRIMIASLALVIVTVTTGSAATANPVASQPSSEQASAALMGVGDIKPAVRIGNGGPAPDWFKDPRTKPFTPMPQSGDKSNARTSEVYLEQGYCRDVYARYYWMAIGANPASCTQGYVKYYDSRNSSYLGAVDVYMLFWNMTPSTAVVTAYNWCTSNFVCSTLLGALVTKYIGAAWKAIRAIRWSL